MTITIHCDKGCGDIPHWFGPITVTHRVIKRLKRELMALHERYFHEESADGNREIS